MKMLLAKKIVHILCDEKFIDSGVRLFEIASPGIHNYLMIGMKKPYNYVKNPDVKSCEKEDCLQEIRKPGVKAVIFHSMKKRNYWLLELIPSGVKVIWLGIGYDYYRMLESAYPNKFLLPQTAALMQPKFGKRVNQSINSMIREAKNSIRPTKKEVGEKLLKRVDYFCPVLDSEYEMVCQHNSWFQPEYVCWNYGTAEDDFSIRSEGTLGNNLLVGNSATATNNHYEAFQSIRKQLDTEGRKVIVPLSYGRPQYRGQVMRCGHELLGESFFPLVEYVNQEQYIQILQSCGFVVMNHIRQQAVGNICISAILGAKLFINPQNPLYDWLQKKGLIIGNSECLDDIPLQKNDRVNNCEAIMAFWGREIQIKKTRNLIEVALQ